MTFQQIVAAIKVVSLHKLIVTSEPGSPITPAALLLEFIEVGLLMFQQGAYFAMK